jgi:hypothetical protein
MPRRVKKLPITAALKVRGDRYRITQAGELKQVRRKGKTDKSGTVTGRLNERLTAASNRRPKPVF